MVDISVTSKYFTFLKKEKGIGYIIKRVSASQEGEAYTLLGLRKIFDEYEKQGYKYISPYDYEIIRHPLFYIRRDNN